MLAVKVHNLTLKNPVMTASGTFGYGEEFADFIDLNRLGGFIVKGTTGTHREGNPYPRMVETPSGMLIIVNVSGSSIEEYCDVASQVDALDRIPAIELNISCPNVKCGGMGFGTSPDMAAQVVSAVRKVYHKTLIVKLSPNVTNIAEIAKAVEGAGADSVSLINTLLGMAIDIERRRPCMANVTGGLSGPAVKPVAVRMVWQVAHAVKIPVVGLGGICTAEDAIEFLMAGATAIEVGTANFIDPAVTVKIIDGMEAWCQRQGVNDINEIIGII